MSTGVSQSELDKVAVLVNQAARFSSLAAKAAVQVKRGDTDSLSTAIDRASAANNAAELALRRLLALGAAHPGRGLAAVERLPLHLLDTPASRAFLSALEAAAEAGAELDRERGWVDADGEAIGHGETLTGMALAMRTEIFGPSGKE